MSDEDKAGSEETATAQDHARASNQRAMKLAIDAINSEPQPHLKRKILLEAMAAADQALAAAVNADAMAAADKALDVATINRPERAAIGPSEESDEISAGAHVSCTELIDRHARCLVAKQSRCGRFRLEVGTVGVVTGVTATDGESTLDVSVGNITCALKTGQVEVQDWGLSIPALHHEPRRVDEDDGDLWRTVRRSKHFEIQRWVYGHIGLAFWSVFGGGQIAEYRIVAISAEGQLEIAMADEMEEIDQCWQCLLTLVTMVSEGCVCEVHHLSGMVHLAAPSVGAAEWQKWVKEDLPHSACSPELPMLMPPRIAATVKTLVLWTLQDIQSTDQHEPLPKWLIELVLRGEDSHRLLTVASLVSKQWAAAASADELWSIHLRQLHLPQAFEFHACAPVALGLADHWAVQFNGAQGENSGLIDGYYVVQDTQHCINCETDDQEACTVPQLRKLLHEIDPFWSDRTIDDPVGPYAWPDHLAFTNSGAELYPESVRKQLLEHLAQAQGAMPQYIKRSTPDSPEIGSDHGGAERTTLVRNDQGIWEITMIPELGEAPHTIAQSVQSWVHYPSDVEAWTVVTEQVGGIWAPWLRLDEEVQQLECELVTTTNVQFAFTDQFSQRTGGQGGLPLKQQCKLIQEEQTRQLQLIESAKHPQEAADLTEACERVAREASDSDAWEKRKDKFQTDLKRRSKKCFDMGLYTVVVPLSVGVGTVTAILLSPLWATGVLSSARFKQGCLGSVVVVAAVPAGTAAIAGGAVGALLSLAADASIATTGATGHLLQQASEGCKNTSGTTFGQWVDEETSKSKANQGGILDGICLGGKGLVLGVADGVTGLVRHPVQGAMESGGLGFVKGASRGLVGIVTSPLAGGLSFVSETTLGVSNRMHSVANLESCKSTIPLL